MVKAMMNSPFLTTSIGYGHNKHAFQA